MKKLMMLLLALLLCLPALAEENAVLPAEVIAERARNNIQVGLDEAIAKAMDVMHAKPAQYQARAELARMTDNSYRWIVTIFDLETLLDAWCVEIDAESGAVEYTEYADSGFFGTTYSLWTAQKGPHALWSLEDKQRFDALYALMPLYGLPMPGDLSAEQALQKALAALDMDDAGGYEVGYGYLMGGEGYNGVWEICLVVDGELDCQVNLDAVNGEVYYLERQMVAPDEANG